MASFMLLVYIALIVAAVLIFRALRPRREKTSQQPGSSPRRTCVVCGTQQGDEDRFCARCGSPLPEE